MRVEEDLSPGLDHPSKSLPELRPSGRASVEIRILERLCGSQRRMKVIELQRIRRHRQRYLAIAVHHAAAFVE